jgi:hypothetical protein
VLPWRAGVKPARQQRFALTATRSPAAIPRGLCHVHGLDRIMFTTGEGPLSWSMLPRYIYLSGEPTFTFDEAQAAWDSIIERFPPSAPMTRAS